MGPCPKCGADGKIPDGSYSNFEDKIFAFLEDIDDIALFQKIANSIQKDLKKNKSPKNIKKKLNKHFSKFKEVWNLIPENKEEAIRIITLLLAFITCATQISVSLRSCTREETINNYYNHLYLQDCPHDQPDNLFDNHNEDNRIQDKPVKI